MNKQIISMTAVAAMAGAALAVESKNVVGYQNVASASFQLVTPTFEKIDGTAWTLAEIKPASIENWNYNSDKILCYDGAQKAFEATYLTQEQAAEIISDSGVEAVAVDGWYDADDVGEWGETGTLKCYNSRELPFGSSGFAVQSSVGIRFIGQVKAAATTSASPSFRLVGNCSPKAITLAQIVPASIENWNYNSDKILCYDGAQKAFEATYLTQEQAAEIISDSGVEAVAVDGWYDADDVGEWGETGTLKCYNSTQFAAGFGFAVQSSVGVIIPSAL